MTVFNWALISCGNIISRTYFHEVSNRAQYIDFSPSIIVWMRGKEIVNRVSYLQYNSFLFRGTIYTALIWAILMYIFKQLISTYSLECSEIRIVLAVLIMMNESRSTFAASFPLFLYSNDSNKLIMKNNCLKAFIWLLFLLLTVAHSLLAILMHWRREESY